MAAMSTMSSVFAEKIPIKGLIASPLVESNMGQFTYTFPYMAPNTISMDCTAIATTVPLANDKVFTTSVGIGRDKDSNIPTPFNAKNGAKFGGKQRIFSTNCMALGAGENKLTFINGISSNIKVQFKCNYSVSPCIPH